MRNSEKCRRENITGYVPVIWQDDDYYDYNNDYDDDDDNEDDDTYNFFDT